MGTLIIGGLAVIALLAIVGSIFLARGGNTDTARRATTVTTPQAAPAASEARDATPPVETLSRPEPPSPPQEPAAQPLQTEQPVEQPLPSTLEIANHGHDEQFVPTTPLANGQSLYIANGQVHELTAQLQALHEEAQHLSQRLSLLTEMAEHIQEQQSTHSEDGL
jgi:hypothetical protein